MSIQGKLSPVVMNGLRKRLQQGVRHVVEERWSRIEVRQSSSLQFKSLSKEIIINEVHQVAFGDSRQVEAVEGRKDLLRRFASWLVDDGLRRSGQALYS